MANNEQYGSWHSDNELQPAQNGGNVINVGMERKGDQCHTWSFFTFVWLKQSLQKIPIKGFSQNQFLGGWVTFIEGTSGANWGIFYRNHWEKTKGG